MSLDTLGGCKRFYGTLDDFVDIQTAYIASRSHWHRPPLWLILEFGMVTTTGTQGQRLIFIEFWTFKTKFQTKINLSSWIFTRFQKVCCLRASYGWYLSICKKKVSIRPQYLLIFLLRFILYKKKRRIEMAGNSTFKEGPKKSFGTTGRIVYNAPNASKLH